MTDNGRKDDGRRPDYKGFAIEMMNEATAYDGACHDIDGVYLQDISARYGLLVPTTMVVPCGDVCMCRDYVEVGDEVTCYRHNWPKEKAND